MSGIGIVGCGISGLQLALYLQQHGVPTTLYAPVPMAATAAGPLPNFVTRWAPTLEREATLGLVDAAAVTANRVRVQVAGTPIRVDGALSGPADATDFRIYLPWLLEIYLERGGEHRVGPCGPAQLAELTERHELVVVAVGRDGFGNTFPLDPERSPYRRPQRHWAVGMYTGAELPEGVCAEVNVVPGLGEIVHVRGRSFDGMVSAIGVAALPAGPAAYLADYPHADDPRGFSSAVLTTLRMHAPTVADRIDERSFAPTRPLDVLRAALVPGVRRPWVDVGGRTVMAVGDAWVLNDPVIAQGANVGSRSAFVLGAAIAAGGPYDEAFARRTEEAMWAQAQAPTTLTNAFLQPTPPHVVALLVRATTDQVLADQVADLGQPERMLSLLAPSPAVV